MKIKLTMRRIHTYSGLFLLLFLLKFGVSAIPFSHGKQFREYYKDKPQWETRFEREYEIEVPEDAGPDELRVIGAKILADLDIKGSFGAWRNGQNRIAVHKFTFGKNTRVFYQIDEKKIIVEDNLFRWDQFLTKFHWIGGYQQSRIIHDIFALMIDLTCLGLIVWIITGLVMWWQNPAVRNWGIVAIASGWLSFIVFMITM